MAMRRILIDNARRKLSQKHGGDRQREPISEFAAPAPDEELLALDEALAKLATKAGVEGANFQVHAPLIAMTKAQIIQTGARLGVDYSMTVSCYRADRQGLACGRCDSCRLRRDGFVAAGLPDPTRYA